MEDKMELLTLLLVLLISGCSYALHPSLTFTQNAELHKDQTPLRSKHLKYVFVPVKVGENRVENITAESTERQKAEQEKGSEGITPNPLGKAVKNEKMEEERREAGLSSQTDSKKQTTGERLEQEEITGRLVAGIHDRKGGAHIYKKRQSAERKKRRKAAKVEKIKNVNGRREDRRAVKHTTSAQGKKKSSIPAIFQIITQPQDPPAPPPHNGSLSPPFTPTQAPPPSSHLPTLYTQVSVHVSPPSVNTPDPTSPSHTSGFTVYSRLQEGVKLKSDFVLGQIKKTSFQLAQKELETPTGKRNPGNRQKTAGNISTPQATTPKPRRAKFTVRDLITEESNPFPKSNESISAELAKPARKLNTTRPKNVQPTELDARVPVKQSKASIHQPHPSKPVANIYQTMAETPPMRPTERVNKNRTAKTSKDKDDTGNKTRTILSNMKELNLLMSFPFMDDFCPPACVCYDSVVQCSNKSVGKVPYGIPYGTRQILLMNNYIKGFQPDVFVKYRSMEVLVLSDNWLTDGAIKGAFSEVPALKRLYLDGNRLKNVPTDLPVSLEELRMDNNYLKAISAGAWSRCPGLFILRLGNNNLGHGPDSFPDAVLSSLRNLHTLSLDHNQLTAVPLGLPPLIKELYLKGNLIEQVREDAFRKTRALEVLDLSANRLTNAGLRNSLNATRLESLNLEGNRLEHVPRRLPPSLTSLNLEGNSISSIKKVDFSRLRKLELLGLAGNKIFQVAPGAFRELASLHRLDLCHNALQQVPRQLPRGLCVVALTNNKIQSVPHDAFCWGNESRSLRGFVEVHLEHNLIDVGKIDARCFRCLQGFQLVHSD